MLNYEYKDGQTYEIGLQPHEEELRRELTKIYQDGDKHGVWLDKDSIFEFDNVATLAYCLEYYQEHNFKDEVYPELNNRIEEYLKTKAV